MLNKLLKFTLNYSMLEGWTQKTDSEGNIVYFNPKIVYKYANLTEAEVKMKHKAKVLSEKEVEQGRSSAYKYLEFAK